MFPNTCLQLTHLRCTFSTPDADVHSAAVGFHSCSSRPPGAMLFVSTSLPAKFLSLLQNTSTFVSTELVFGWASISPFSRSLWGRFFFFLNKNKFRWQWINYTVTNTELIHFPPWRLLRLLTPGWRCSTLTALEGKFQSIPFHLIPVQFFPWSHHDRFSDGNLFFYTSLQAILWCAANSAIFWQH